MSAATARMELRVPKQFKRLAEQASAIKGERSTAEYIKRLVEEDARRVIEQHQTMSLSETAFDRFVSACDNAAKPNDALKRAAKRAKESGYS